MTRVNIVEIKGFDVLAGTEKVLYFADQAFSAFPGSDVDRPHQFYEPRLTNIGGYKRSMFGAGRTVGRSENNAGTLSLSNADGALDYLQSWGFSGREIRLYKGVLGAAFNAFTLILKATVKLPVFNFDSNIPSTVDFTIVDRQSEMDEPIQTVLYAGSNSGPSGDEGLASDIQGTPKPLGFGRNFNVTAVPSNTSALRYQVNDGPILSINAVYAKGLPLSYNAFPSPGQYSTDLANGRITLGGTPLGTITVDYQGYKKDNSLYIFKTADLMAEIAETYGGVSQADIDTVAVAALNAANSAAVAIYIDSETSLRSVLDQLASSIGAYWLFDQLGRFTMGRIEDPVGAIDHELNDSTILSITRIQSSDKDKGVPVYLSKVKYRKNYTVQTADRLAGSVSDLRRAELEKPFRTTAAVTDSNVKLENLLSPELSRETLLSFEADADVENNRLLGLYKVRRFFYSVVLPDIADFETLDLGQIVNITFPRFGLDLGKKFLCLSIELNAPDINSLTIEVWG